MEKNPERRYQTFSELRADLKNILRESKTGSFDNAATKINMRPIKTTDLVARRITKIASLVNRTAFDFNIGCWCLLEILHCSKPTSQPFSVNQIRCSDGAWISNVDRYLSRRKIYRIRQR